VRQAALRPILGADKVVRYLAGLLGKNQLPVSAAPALVNGSPALVVRLDGEVDGVIAVRVEDGRVTGLYYVRNPEKLNRVEAETPLTLHPAP
jgi:RNA polymerase sigma-70 factor (ECF subfamily)